MNKGSVPTKVIVCIFILIIGATAAMLFAQQIDQEQRQVLLQETKYAALLVTPADVATLSASDADIGAPVYERLKEQFTLFRSYNSRVRFVYLMGYHPEIKTQFFYVDSEPVDSVDYSPPGQLFADSTAEDIDAYLSGRAYTSGPYRDSWGEWISGNVPIISADGSTAAMVGIDIATSVWRRDTGFVWVTVGSITLLLVILAWVMLTRIEHKQRSIDALTAKNKTLERDETKLREIQSLGQLGKVTIYSKDKRVMLDESLAGLLTTKATLSFDEFLSLVHRDDQEAAHKALNEITSGSVQYTWFDIRVGTRDGGYRLYHCYGNVESSADGMKFSGIMQDITDIQK